ncbi:MAG TPA: hypothetical protein PLF81_24390 [Candidatus Anammoximicrobium sp.]|nr:hypothetical protein [Candidatus Anammoximicrobium sp.]
MSERLEMSEKLGEALHRLRIETLVRQAQMIHDYPPGEERTGEARKLLYGVLYDHALGRLSYDERERILGLVDFARDYHAPEATKQSPALD